MHRKNDGLLQFHIGEEKYQYLGMPFGLISDPGVYQMLNGVISIVLRSYGIFYGLYIDDRCALLSNENPFVWWAMTALSCCCGHFLSLGYSENIRELKNLYVPVIHILSNKLIVKMLISLE